MNIQKVDRNDVYDEPSLIDRNVVSDDLESWSVEESRGIGTDDTYLFPGCSDGSVCYPLYDVDIGGRKPGAP